MITSQTELPSQLQFRWPNWNLFSFKAISWRFPVPIQFVSFHPKSLRISSLWQCDSRRRSWDLHKFNQILGVPNLPIPQGAKVFKFQKSSDNCFWQPDPRRWLCKTRTQYILSVCLYQNPFCDSFFHSHSPVPWMELVKVTELESWISNQWFEMESNHWRTMVGSHEPWLARDIKFEVHSQMLAMLWPRSNMILIPFVSRTNNWKWFLDYNSYISETT